MGTHEDLSMGQDELKKDLITRQEAFKKEHQPVSTGSRPRTEKGHGCQLRSSKYQVVGKEAVNLLFAEDGQLH
jgi:hypothetical protein